MQVTNNTHISKCGYKKPTPVKIANVADTINGAMTAIGATAAVTASPTLGLILIIIGQLAKVISAFFHEA